MSHPDWGPPPGPDYSAQHRVVALQCACQLIHLELFTSVKEVIKHAATLAAYLDDGTIPE